MLKVYGDGLEDERGRDYYCIWSLKSRDKVLVPNGLHLADLKSESEFILLEKNSPP
jgi:hypothetical protein